MTEVRASGGTICGPLVGALVILNALDIATTMQVLALGGVEGNPIMRPFVGQAWTMILIKSLGLALVAVVVDRTDQSPIVRRALWATVLLYAWVVVNNLEVLTAIS
jgi:hypothetical protein